MRIYHLLAIAGLSAALAAPVHAQSIKKVGADVHHALKKAGNTVKQDAGEVGAAAHHTLQKAGNDTKTAAGNATGIHKVGGSVGQAAQAVSHTSKKASRKAKKTLKKTSSAAHDSLTKAGKNAKSAVKKP